MIVYIVSEGSNYISLLHNEYFWTVESIILRSGTGVSKPKSASKKPCSI